MTQDKETLLKVLREAVASIEAELTPTYGAKRRHPDIEVPVCVNITMRWNGTTYGVHEIEVGSSGGMFSDAVNAYWVEDLDSWVQVGDDPAASDAWDDAHGLVRYRMAHQSSRPVRYSEHGEVPPPGDEDNTCGVGPEITPWWVEHEEDVY